MRLGEMKQNKSNLVFCANSREVGSQLNLAPRVTVAVSGVAWTRFASLTNPNHKLLAAIVRKCCPTNYLYFMARRTRWESFSQFAPCLDK